ncbi:hypothetical protein [Streptomyces parvus]|uniref:hypothetical protein n=1 Tax=Streptomyces parvus TaxID=66428 RepID=UPI002100D92C|nr:hypothetical protein [Streptomyces parvus]MCQ1581873.1 hypothetical protein [Streptomyces parvus]
MHDDLVGRAFTADGPNRLWLTDVTEHPTSNDLGGAVEAVLASLSSEWKRVADLGWTKDQQPLLDELRKSLVEHFITVLAASDPATR